MFKIILPVALRNYKRKFLNHLPCFILHASKKTLLLIQSALKVVTSSSKVWYIWGIQFVKKIWLKKKESTDFYIVTKINAVLLNYLFIDWEKGNGIRKQHRAESNLSPTWASVFCLIFSLLYLSVLMRGIFHTATWKFGEQKHYKNKVARLNELSSADATPSPIAVFDLKISWWLDVHVAFLNVNSVKFAPIFFTPGYFMCFCWSKFHIKMLYLNTQLLSF